MICGMPAPPSPIGIRDLFRSAIRAMCFTALMLAGGDSLAQELVVFAASSLTESFEEIAAAFEAQHADMRVLLAFGGSSTLALQILQGAPADVFASADLRQMQRLVDDGLVAGEPEAFATNRLAIIASEGAGVTNVGDLARDGLRVVLAGPEVPVGAYARVALASLNAVHGADFFDRVVANLVSEEPNVRQAAASVELGEVDAAIVYATDAVVANGVEVLEVPPPHDVVAMYPIAVLEGGRNRDLARAFVAFVRSSDGQAILAAHGFRPVE